MGPLPFILEAGARSATELTRYRVMMITAVVAGAAAVGSVAAHLPMLITATLGFIAASCVGIQAVLHDQECGVAKHAMVVEMTAARREFRFGSGDDEPEEALRRRFQVLRQKVSAIKSAMGHGQ